MNTKKKLPDLKLKILCVLADNKYHTSREIEETLDLENKKRIEEKKLRSPRTLLFDRENGHVLGFKDVPKRKEQEFYKSIYKSNLSVELRELISLDWIDRELRDKKCNPVERGHKKEFVYYIKKDTYHIVDEILGRELEKEKHRLRGAVKGLDDWPLNYGKSLKRVFQWNHSKNPSVFERYIQAALDSAEYKEVDGQPYRASIPSIPELSDLNVIDKENCREQLKSLLEEWIAHQLSLGLAIPPKDDRHPNTLLPLSIGPLRERDRMELDKLMKEAVQENIRLTNEWINEQKAESKEEPK